jgi:hypothetical protein
MILGYNAGRSLKLSNFLYRKFCELLFELAPSSVSKDKIAKYRKGLVSAHMEMEKSMQNEFPYCKECFISIYYFLSFLITQMFRTKRTKDRIINIKNRLISHDAGCKYKHILDGINYNSIYALLVHCGVFKVGISLIMDEYKIVFIDNKSDINFVTSDQPVINTYVTDNKEVILGDDELELYYPLTPKLAMLLTKEMKYDGINIVEAGAIDVLRFNRLLSGNAWHFVYGLHKDDVLEAVG